ncbi:MAG: hypothetical protein ACREP6_08480 [Candidatus Binataceae bacterium]
MLKKADRVQIVVNDCARAGNAAAALFGAELIKRDMVAPLGARRATMQAGTSLIEILEPISAGPAKDHLERWGEGLFAAGFAVEDLDSAEAALARARIAFQKANGQLYPDPAALLGMRAVLSARHERAPIGPIRSIYEATFLVSDFHSAAGHYAASFALDPARFVPIAIAEFGYTGTLLMFDPPSRLDRIELAQVTDFKKPMGRFFSRRGGNCWYMFYAEAGNLEETAARLKAVGASFTEHRGLSTLYLHPSAFCGTLIGISRTGAAWGWSGDPSRAKAAGIEPYRA